MGTKSKGGARLGLNVAQVRKKLLAGAAAEDLEGLSKADLDWVSAHAAKFLTARKPGRIAVRVENPKTSSGALAERTILEILNDDMPFLVDSVVNALSLAGLTVFTVLHPVLQVSRARTGKLERLVEASEIEESHGRESYIHIHLERLNDAAQRDDLAKHIESILEEVRAAVVDWKPMLQTVQDAIGRLRNSPSPLPTSVVSESIDFLSWLLNNKFTFLGATRYEVSGRGKARKMQVVKGAALGILRLNPAQVLRNAANRDPALYKNDRAILIEKSDLTSRVHRTAVMDYIGIYDFDETGEIRSELRLVGLFTSGVYTESAASIPILKRKFEMVMARSGYVPSGHSGKGLMNVLETMARDDLFQMDVDDLEPLATGMWRLQERPRVRLFARTDRFSRYAIAYVYFPRDRFSSELRETAGNILQRHFNGKVVEFLPDFGEGTMVRVRFTVSSGLGASEEADLEAAENEIIAATRAWSDDLGEALEKANGASGSALLTKYARAFGSAYQADTPAAEAVHDISEMESICDASPTRVEFMPPRGDHGSVRLKLYNRDKPVPLSSRLPLLENMGLVALDENTHVVHPAGTSAERSIYIHEVALDDAGGTGIDQTAYERLEDCFMAVWTGRADNDRLNGLVLVAGLDWHIVTALRSFVRYLRQTGFAFAIARMARTLVRLPHISRDLAELFAARFQPDYKGAGSQASREKKQHKVMRRLDTALRDVPDLNDDRIVRQLAGVIRATLRTNFFELDALQGEIPIALAMKIRSSEVPAIPAPVPFAEIFVHSTLVEGVHLRGGMISRGGLRWSDRPDDFRTEVLGLAKAQNVKNSVIVPLGAKGGFVPRRLPDGGTRDEVYAAGTLAYRCFISSLLSVTDDSSGNKVVPPKNIVRHDGDDPYLVVAADKGTAAFSDVANAISQNAGFWLDDAFASGGSAGYDHKKMGITARGGWEAVKRHFREMNRDIQTEPFTAIGVGDMSGDVFGNGMLLSEQTCLLAAFDHRDIFIDPSPDPAKSYAERRRLFELPRSSWQDYSKKLISRGGGVFSRSEKEISLSAEIRQMLGISEASLTPGALLRAILKCDADLLWFGGIGTYVRASSEPNSAADDKANDAIRITANELNVRAIGEGANLGVTQLARIEFAAGGGYVNTDAIDNSAGVNSSDVEVNLKIAFGQAETDGKLTRKKRNSLLASMTDDVADLVLRNNYLQTLCLSLAQRGLAGDAAGLERLMGTLEELGGLDREIEFLPEHDALKERINSGEQFTRPELAVLVAYSKIVLFDDMLSTSLAGDAYLERELMRYFPGRMLKPFGDEIRGHKLRDEIVCTLLSNSIVNRCGPLFAFDLARDANVSTSTVVQNFVLARDSFGFTAMNEAIDALDCKVDGARQLQFYEILKTGLANATAWFARNEDPNDGLEGLVNAYSGGLMKIAERLDELLTGEQMQELKGMAQDLIGLGVESGIAYRIAGVRHLVRGLDVIRISRSAGVDISRAAEAYFSLATSLTFDQIVVSADALPRTTEYDRPAIDGIILALTQDMRAIAAAEVAGKLSAGDRQRIEEASLELRSSATGSGFSLAQLAVIASRINGLVRA